MTTITMMRYHQAKKRPHPCIFLLSSIAACCGLGVVCNPCPAQDKDFNAYSGHVATYLKRLYDSNDREFVFREGCPYLSPLTIVATQWAEPSGRLMAAVPPPDRVVVGPQLPVSILTQRSWNVALG